MLRRGAVARTFPRRLPVARSFGVNARDHVFRNARPCRTTRPCSTRGGNRGTRTRRPGSSNTNRAVQPKNGAGTGGVCLGHQWRGGHLYLAVGFSVAEHWQSGRAASEPGSFRVKTGSGCRCLEGYSVGAAATCGLAEGEQGLGAAKRSPAAAGFGDPPFAATKHHGRTRRCEEGLFTALHVDREDRLAAKCNDVGRHVLHSTSACPLWTVRSDAQADGSAIEVRRARFDWRSPPEYAGCGFGTGKLKTRCVYGMIMTLTQRARPVGGDDQQSRILGSSASCSSKDGIA